MYYYGLDNIHSYRNNNKFIFRNKNGTYFLEPIRNREEVFESYQILRDNNKYFPILTNINNSIFTTIYGVDYVLLLKRNNSNYKLVNEILNNNYIITTNTILNRSDWLLLWEQKLDYYEYQLDHIAGNYKVIDESIYYFLGMGETAISYIRYNITNNTENLVISHRRIDDKNYFNPLNIVVDYKARDVSEYLKYLFINKKYYNFDFLSFFRNLNFSKNSFILLYGRLFFPSFYFDLYDRIINNSDNESLLVPIIRRIDEYEYFLNLVYKKINQIIEIPKVDWI